LTRKYSWQLFFSNHRKTLDSFTVIIAYYLVFPCGTDDHRRAKPAPRQALNYNLSYIH